VGVGGEEGGGDGGVFGRVADVGEGGDGGGELCSSHLERKGFLGYGEREAARKKIELGRCKKRERESRLSGPHGCPGNSLFCVCPGSPDQAKWPILGFSL
jgi:hypothetical protein